MQKKELSQIFFDNRSLRIAVTNILHKLGVPANVKGFFYLREAIILNIKTPDITSSMRRILYPHIADMFHNTTTQVERGIRYAIKISWARGNHIFQQKLFQQFFSASSRRPTTAEFITTIASYFRNHLQDTLATC